MDGRFRVAGLSPGATGVGEAMRVSISWRAVPRVAMLLAEAPALAALLFMLAVAVLIGPDSAARFAAIDISYPALALCPVLESTGLPCLFCGMTRSWLAMGGLDPVQAFTYHPLGPSLFVVASAAALYLALALITEKRLVIRAGAVVWLTVAGLIVTMLFAAWPLKVLIWMETGLLEI